jgi:hypothetical protein
MSPLFSYFNTNQVSAIRFCSYEGSRFNRFPLIVGEEPHESHEENSSVAVQFIHSIHFIHLLRERTKFSLNFEESRRHLNELNDLNEPE